MSPQTSHKIKKIKDKTDQQQTLTQTKCEQKQSDCKKRKREEITQSASIFIVNVN